MVQASGSLQEGAIGQETQVDLASNALVARNFFALETVEDLIRAIHNVTVGFQAGGKSLDQKGGLHAECTLSVAKAAAHFTFQP
jgi:hypothetical protein